MTDGLLSFVARDFLFTMFPTIIADGFLSSTTNGLFSTIIPFIIADSFLFIISPPSITGGFLSVLFLSVNTNGLLSSIAGNTSPSVSLLPLFLPAIISIIRKRLFDWAFIIIKPLALTKP